MLQISFPNQFRRIAKYVAPDTSSIIKKLPKGRESPEYHGKAQGSRAGQHRAIFNMLTDDVLLEVFDWYLEQWNNNRKWTTLVHVCRRWRHIVFGSPRRLDLCLLCTYGTPVRRRLNCWPSLPIVIKYWANLEFRPPSHEDEDNLMAALEHPDRVREIQVAATSSLLEKVTERMQVRFPALTSLSLWMDKAAAPILPTTFLTGYTSCLRDISLIGISFPRLSRLLSSTIDLVSLRLLEVRQVPGAGYTSPELIATCLSMLPHLKVLCIDFCSPPSCRYSQGHRHTPITREFLPSLTRFNFRGTSEYLEGLVARIDAPFLSQVDITFFNQLIFDVPHLSRFIDQMELLKLAKMAEVESSTGNGVSITVALDSNLPHLAEDLDNAMLPVSNSLGYILTLAIACTDLDWQISAMAQICRQAFSFLSNVEHLDIRADCIRNEDDMDSIAWLDFFHSFPSVEMLRISGELGPHVAPALDGVDREMTREVLPELRMLWFECSRKSAPIEHFVAARKLSNRPVYVQHALFPCVWDYSYT